MDLTKNEIILFENANAEIEVTNIDPIKGNFLYAKYLGVEIKLSLVNSKIEHDNIKIGDIVEVCLSLVGNQKDNTKRWVGYEAEFMYS